MAEKEVMVDRMGIVFANIIRVLTIIGVIVLLVPAIFYFMGQNQYIPLKKASEYWHEPAVVFWKDVMKRTVHGFGWIFSHLKYTDCQSLVGVIILIITPLIGVLAAIPTGPQKAYKVLLAIMTIEFIIAIIIRGIM